uniref:Type IV fimbrial assembly, ATPase PilB n=1 Tax=Rheinheimera sp. BAL341 TaxID=1708203 RepID=A0A486XVE6_9GAMM
MLNVSALLTNDFNVAAEDLQKALVYQQRNGSRLEQILIRMGALSSELLPHYYSAVFQLPLLLDEAIPSAEALINLFNALEPLLNKTQLNRLVDKGVVPVAASWNDSELNALTIACINPAETGEQEFLAATLNGCELQVLVCTEEQLAGLQFQLQNSDASVAGVIDLSMLEEDRLRELASEAPTVNLLNNLIAKGLRRRASDMHIEPWKKKGRVRYRIDGVLHDADIIPAQMLLPVVTRLKLLSRMDIAEKRRPQDGKIELRVDGRNVDIRVSALPVGEGESVVMRFLLQDALSYDIKTLGIEADIEQHLLQDLQTTSGVILMTGPTGSGKTTSLYSFLSRRNEPGVKIITIEDPVEYQLDGINQVQVQSDIDYTFASALRSVVRQDPDIIMVGEIRDYETASIALQSALTGHLVFSTLHTNDAPSAFTRLLDLGVEEFLLSAAVKVVLAQRLVRKLCPHCAEPEHESAKTVERLNLGWLAVQQKITPQFKKEVGCEHCGYTGYLGRVAIIEYLKCDDELRQLFGKPGFLTQAALLNKQRGFRNLLQDGVLKAMRGETTLAEVLRVAG